MAKTEELTDRPGEIFVTAENADLTNCARERIHIPSSIQPHGCTIVAEPDTLRIVRTSDNVGQFLEFEPDAAIGASAADLLPADLCDRIRSCLAGDLAAINPLRLDVKGRSLNLIVHQHGGFVFLEFEPADDSYTGDFLSFHHLTRKVMDDIQKAETFEELCDVIVRNIRSITGFDRTMIYHFEEDGSGHVIAEDKQPDLEPFLGLHYPATDIPTPARQLYRFNYIRLIPDVDYERVPLLGHPETGEPFDLSYSTLRSVSPLHVEYLHNMGVRASMSISLIHEGTLWGLIACHHYAGARYLPYEVRTACEFLGKVMSLQLLSKQDRASLKYQKQIKDTQATLIEALSNAIDVPSTLKESRHLLVSLVGAAGLGVCFSSELSLFGQTPDEASVKSLVKWLRKTQDRNFFYTDRLAELYSPAAAFTETASGVAVLYLSRFENSYLVWFRPEIAQTVNWAGKPSKPAQLEADGTITLSPRQSFALWQQNVTGRSQPWQPHEIRQIQELRSLLVDIIFKTSNELVELNFELQRSNDELDSFAYIASHDLKEPLRGVFNYSYLLLEDYENVLDEDGVRKLNMLMTLTKRMEKLIDALLHYSRLGRQELLLEPVDIAELVNTDIQLILEVSQQKQLDLRIPCKIPTVRADRTLLEEVLMNLITNGLKYNTQEYKWVEIGCERDAARSSQPIFYVRDNGIGISADHQSIVFRIFKRLHGQKQYGGGTGAGLTIVKKIVERHGGKIWLVSEKGQGTTFYFTLAPEVAE